MRRRHFLTVLAACMLPALPAEAKKKKKNKQKSAQNQKAEQEKQERARQREERREAVKDFLADRDKNGDGSLTREEFLSGAQNKENGNQEFDAYNKNGDRYLTKSEIEALLGYR